MSNRNEFGVDVERALSARFPFDSKSHKLARRQAIRAKYAEQASHLRDDSADTVTLSRKLRRYGALGAMLALLALSTPHAFAWGGKSGSTYHGKAHTTHAGNGSARASFRSAVTGN